MGKVGPTGKNDCELDQNNREWPRAATPEDEKGSLDPNVGAVETVGANR